MSSALIMLLAFGIDAAIGWPAAIYARIGHPVTWIGAAISWLDRTLNSDGAADSPSPNIIVVTPCRTMLCAFPSVSKVESE